MKGAMRVKEILFWLLPRALLPLHCFELLRLYYNCYCYHRHFHYHCQYCYYHYPY